MSASISEHRRIFAISDLHVDHKENLEFIKSWPHDFYADDALLIAGDVTDNLSLLEQTLRIVKNKFARVFFVPGNHDLWIRNRDKDADSIEKFKHILQLCESIGIATGTEKFQVSDNEHVWIVPMMSWYSTPEEDLSDSLYYTAKGTKEDAKCSNDLWMDNHLCKWPNLNGLTKSQFFAEYNDDALNRIYDAPVISLSHFIPRLDLVGTAKEDEEEMLKERKRLGLENVPPPKAQGGLAGFNFTRFAGSKIIETQLRKVGSAVHVFGHQHRNRDRVINGVRYVSHCVGTKKERDQGFMWGLHEWEGAKQIWPPTRYANNN